MYIHLGILLSDKRLYNVVVWVGRQKAMKWVFFHQRVTYVYTFIIYLLFIASKVHWLNIIVMAQFHS